MTKIALILGATDGNGAESRLEESQVTMTDIGPLGHSTTKTMSCARKGREQRALTPCSHR